MYGVEELLDFKFDEEITLKQLIDILKIVKKDQKR